MQEILEGLDDEQRRAATTIKGPVRIIAGAGAGKTRTVTRRIAYACASGAWDPKTVLAVTFSTKAAAELCARLAALGVNVNAATFHSAALSQLRKVWYDVCEAPFPHVTDQQNDIVQRALLRASGRSDFDMAVVREVRDEINWAKISLVAVEDYAKVCNLEQRESPAGIEASRFADVYAAYEQEKTSRGEIDFDDILLLTCHILDDFPESAAQIRNSISTLTVDEYQDVSPLQHRLMKLWLGGDGPLNRNVCVVGDPAQTIYSFAGASSWDLLHFDEEFGPLAADVQLNTDYRSTASIVSCANKVLAKSPNRTDYLKLTSAQDRGPRVVRTVYESDAEEAQGVVGRIERLIAEGAKPSDIAILTRINAQQPPFVAELRSRKIPFRVRRDSKMQQVVLDDNSAAKSALLEAMGFAAEARALDPGVTVSTIHAAKGLEFKHVFLIGCSEGLMPYQSPQQGETLEEERRLMYVAITRAEKTLHMSYAKSKDGYSRLSRQPSRFLV